jgi:hypothetical protein
MSLPFALCAVAKARTKARRDMLLVVALISVFPLVFSLNRGAWLSAVAGVLYATIRLARGRNGQLLRVVAVASMILGVLFFVTPLGEIVMTRLQNGYGDAHRAELYSESLTAPGLHGLAVVGPVALLETITARAPRRSGGAFLVRGHDLRRVDPDAVLRPAALGSVDRDGGGRSGLA